jgi:uncharacterized surface protein with fasciclin (FAS1) repeats
VKRITKGSLCHFTLVILLCLFAQQSQAQDERASMLQYAIANNPVLGDAIAKAGLAPILSGDGMYTLFLPPDAELNNLKNEPAQRVRTILSGHILKGKYLESDLKDGASIETLAGTKVIICRKKDYTLVDGVRITGANIEVKNGLIHKLSSSIKL